MKQVRLSDYLYEVVKEKIRRRTKKAPINKEESTEDKETWRARFARGAGRSLKRIKAREKKIDFSL